LVLKEDTTMKYWDMLKVSDPPVIQQPVVVPEPNIQSVETKTDDKYVELSDNVKKIMEMINDISNKNNEPPQGYDATSLKDNEIADVLTWLLEFRDKYFKEIPLAEVLQKSFVWNIPREVYEMAVKVTEYDYPDCLNPMFWFFIFCIDMDEYSISKFIILADNAMSDEDREMIEQFADEYDESLADDQEMECDDERYYREDEEYCHDDDDADEYDNDVDADIPAEDYVEKEIDDNE